MIPAWLRYGVRLDPSVEHRPARRLSIELRSGEIWAGRYRTHSDDGIFLEPFGTGCPRWFFSADISAVYLAGPHTADEERAAGDLQHRGEPAARRTVEIVCRATR